MLIKTVSYLLLALLLGCHKQFAVNNSNGSAADSYYAFSEVRLMSDANEISARYKKTGDCLVVGGIVADCKYHDWNGISYGVFEGKVVRIEADGAFLKKGTRLPFDLALGDDRASVLKKLLRHRNVAGIEALLTGLKSGEKNVSVAIEDKRLDEDDFEFFLVFDDDDDLRALGSMVTVI